MMIPEAWENHAEMDPARRAFYEFHSTMMEAWDGPACVVFTDGTQIGAVLDRNGLRPSRYWVTDDGLVVLASEVGVLDLDPATIVRKGRLQPGRMFLVDTEEHRIIEDEEIKAELAAEHPYDEWLHAGLVHLDDVPQREHVVHTHASVTRRQQVFGYTEEQLRVLLTPMANTGAEPIGSMGTDTPIAALSRAAAAALRLLRPALRPGDQPAAGRDPRGAGHVAVGLDRPGGQPARADRRRPAARSCCPSRSSTTTTSRRSATSTATATCPASRSTSSAGCTTSRAAARRSRPGWTSCAARCRRRSRTARACWCSPTAHSTAELAPIPSLLLTGALHHHLVREKTRSQVGLLVEAGDVREVHHVALLVGYGAAAVNPYLAMESVEDLAREGYYVTADPEVATKNLVSALGKGVLKVMCKMGVSTVASYTGAQIFEAVGLSQAVVDKYFTGTTSKLGGVEPRTHGRGGRAPPRRGLPPRRHLARPPRARGRRRVPVAPRGRAPPVRPRDGLPAAARDPRGPLRRLQAVHLARRRAVRAADDAARPLPLPRRRQPRPPAGAGRGGRAGLRDRQALLHRRDVLRVHLAGGPRDPRDRDEPAGRQVQHRRGRRGRRPPPRPGAPQRHQAGRLRAVRRDGGVPRQLRRHPDQDGPGRQARRGRPAARPQGLPLGGQDPALDAGRGPHQPAAAPRHLLDRGPGAADPRPQERQPVGPRPRQARGRGRGRHGRGRRVEGPRRRRPHLRSRRRHRRVPADLAQARRGAVGARPRRDAADPAAQRPARPHRRADRRPAEDGPRRRDRRAARGGGVRLRRPRRWSCRAAS